MTAELDVAREELVAVRDEIRADPARARPIARAMLPMIDGILAGLDKGDVAEARLRALGTRRSIGEDSRYAASQQGRRLAAALVPLLTGD